MTDIVHATAVSLVVASGATTLALAAGVPTGLALGLRDRPGLGHVRTLVYTLYGFPPVVAGLVVYMVFSNAGPLGSLDWLFTPATMIVAETLLIFPIVTGTVVAGISEVPQTVKDQAASLGASPWQRARLVLGEARTVLLAAVMMGLGRGLSEVGAAFLVGGNIAGHTRTLTTAILLETRRGQFALALALAAILLTMASLIYYGLRKAQEAGP